MELQKELRRLQEAAGIKYGAGIYDQIGSTADVKDAESKPKQQQAGTGVESDAVSEEKDDACNNSDCVTDVDADGYFPETDHGTKVNSAGPAAARAGDNPMQKSMKTQVTEMRKLAGLSEGCHYGESVDEDEDTEDEDKDSSEVIKEAYSSFFNMLQDEFKKANLK